MRSPQSLHLGSKLCVRKLATEIRAALQQYRLWDGDSAKEMAYEGERHNGMRWGRGRLLYDNGFEFDGGFVQNYRHGAGTVTLNGTVLCEGQWSLGELSGDGSVNSLGGFSDCCPTVLCEAAYRGQLLQNRLHGTGTLFLSATEKFVTAFACGVPIGGFAFYGRSDVEFGSWL
jgi:hypothetical protein